MMDRQMRIAIAGGGISGLAAAYRLQQAGVDVQVFEAAPQCGGRVSSEAIGDFLVNCGADVVPSAYEAVVRLYKELELLEDQPECIASTIGFVRDGKVHRLRSNHLIRDGLATRLLSWRSKFTLLRLGVDALRVGRALRDGAFGNAQALDTLSAADYASKKLNDEIRRYVIQPLAQGISQGASIVDFLFTASKTIGSGFVQYKGGIGMLTEALAERVPVIPNCKVDTVERSGDGVCLTFAEEAGRPAALFDAAIVAVPGALVPDMVPELPLRVRELLTEELRYSHLFPAQFGLRIAPDESAGILFDDADSEDDLVSISLEHNLRADACPNGKGLLTVLFTPEWAEANADSSDEALLDEMLAAVERILPGTTNQVEIRRLYRWAYGAQQALPGYCAHVDELRGLLDPAAPIQLAGDYFGSSSTNACVLAAEQAVKAILQNRR